jgi:hypothetical protein
MSVMTAIMTDALKKSDKEPQTRDMTPVVAQIGGEVRQLSDEQRFQAIQELLRVTAHPETIKAAINEWNITEQMVDAGMPSIEAQNTALIASYVAMLNPRTPSSMSFTDDMRRLMMHGANTDAFVLHKF